jgi:ferredoxin/nitrate reductase gamma subunit
LILWIATDLVAIHFDTPFQIFKGTTYIVVSFLADIAGLAILIGLALAYYRRYILKPAYLSASKPQQEKFMYAMLVWLVVIGYLLEGLRILGTGMPNDESWISPIGWMVASLFIKCDFSETTLAYIYRTLWGIHMLNTMAFLASIPFSKFAHIFWGPLNSLLTPYRRGAVLNPMDFSNENAETFGLGKSTDLTSKQRLDTLACVECGRCTQVCPANQAEKPLNPKTIITKMRDKLFEHSDGGLKTPTEFNIWENSLYSGNELDSCTTCGACMEECPMSIEHVSLIMDLKRYKALTLGELPPSAADAVNKIKINGNPWGIAQDDRMKWADGLDVPTAKEGEKIDYLYYVGCAGSYDANNQKVVKDTVMLLKKAGVSFAIMGKTEKCNGDPIRRFGDEYSFFEIAIENIANMKKYSFNKVVTHCPTLSSYNW